MSIFIQEKLRQFNESRVDGLFAEVLHDVAKAADQLEHNLDENIFDEAMIGAGLVKINRL